MARTIVTTSYLQQFLMQNNDLRESAMIVAEALRAAKHMSTEGTIGDTLKSAPFFYRCAALHSRSHCNTPEGLFREIAQFDASEWQVTIQADVAVATGTAPDAVGLYQAIRCSQRLQRWRAHTLVIIVIVGMYSQNVARRVSGPRLALIQQTCATAIDMQSPISMNIVANDFDFNSISSTSRHEIADRWTSSKYPVVTNISRKKGGQFRPGPFCPRHLDL